MGLPASGAGHALSKALAYIDAGEAHRIDRADATSSGGAAGGICGSCRATRISLVRGKRPRSVVRRDSRFPVSQRPQASIGFIAEFLGSADYARGAADAESRRSDAVPSDRTLAEWPESHLNQFSTLSPATRSNSPTLSVTNTISSANDCAAIKRSFGPISRPDFSSAARKSP